MAQPILQAFLNENLISIDQNEEFIFLTKAANEFEKRLRVKRTRIVLATLLAFDPTLEPNDPLITEVKELITSRWKAFPSKCKDQPVPYVRAVILSALQELAKEANDAGIIWLTASNYFPFIQATQRETKLLETFLNEIGDTYQKASWQSWGLEEKYSEPEVPKVAKSPLPEVPSISKDHTVKRMSTAVGVIDESGNSEVFANWQDRYSSDQPLKASPEWITSFGTIAGSLVKNVADVIVLNVNKALAEAASSKQLDEYTTEITRYLREVGESMSRQTASHNLRSQLLWLKESMYSTSRQVSYRKLPLEVISLALANDAVQIIPAIYPISVDYFLREILREANGETEVSLTFEELLIELKAASATIQQILTNTVSFEEGRISLMAFVSGLAIGTVQKEDFEKATGLHFTDITTRQEFAVWIFRELQVRKLAATK